MNHAFIDILNSAFIGILNHALIASLLMIAVIVVRFIIKRAPKWITCVLWGLVAIKLVLPFHIESVLSLIPSSKPIPTDIAYSATPHIETGVHAINQVVNPVLEANFAPKPEYSVNLLQVVISVCAHLWMIGIICLLLYLLITYFLLRKKVTASKKIDGNVFICDEISSPFILGIVKPQIYLPSGLSAAATECVLAHEKTHLKRCDHFWKPLGFIILTLYWFHPLCWVAYVLLCRDIELACDEKVTKDKDKSWKATYCQALLDCSYQKKMITACPVAFGEGSVRERIKTVLNYKKPAFWIVVTAIAISVIVAVCFMTNPAEKSAAADIKNEMEENAEAVEVKSGAENQKTVFSEGDFDNIMGYSGQYIYYEGYPPEGFYYASDGRLLASVWGTTPEEVGVIDLDGDGKNELIAGLMWGDGGTDVVVYKEFASGIRYAYCSDMFVENYDNFGVGALGVAYLKETNQVKFSYWIDAEQNFRTAIYDIYPDWLTWQTPYWLTADASHNNILEETMVNDFFGDQRDWPCGTISEIMPGTINGTEFTISLKYYVSEDDSDMIRKLGLTEADFPSGYAVEPVGETRIYPVSENCEFIFVDWSHIFTNDSRVKSYDENHVITDDYSVFQEYLDTYKSLNHQFFFYDIQDGRIQTIYEAMHP